MLITAVCPTCKNHYQLQPALLGQTIRCPNASCRRPFVVTNGDAAAPSSRITPVTGTPQYTGNVGELVPILPASVEAPLSLAEPATASWQEPPPVRQPHSPSLPSAEPVALPKAESTAPRPSRKQRPRIREMPPSATPEPMEALAPVAVPEPSVEPKAAPPETNGPRELPPGAWEAPPVRRGQGAEETVPDGAVPPVRKRPFAPTPARRPWALYIALSVCMLAVIGLGATVLVVFIGLGKVEDDLRAEATEALKDERFEEAEARFRELQQRFPKSPHLPGYIVGQQYAQMRGRLKNSPPDTVTALNELDAFIREHIDDPAAAPYFPELNGLVLKLIASFQDENPTAQGLSLLASVDTFEKLIETLTNREGGLDPEKRTEALARLQRVRNAVALWREQDSALKKLAEFLPTWDGIKAARQLVARMKEKFPEGFRAEAEKRLLELESQQAAKGTFFLHDKPVTPPAEAPLPRLWFVSGSNNAAAGTGGVKFFLARGLLYVLNRADGSPRWCRHVGLDTYVLPVRLPHDGVGQDQLLVWSSDARTLTCLSEDGRSESWSYFLGRPLAGKPLVVTGHVYLAGVDGEVHIVDAADGRFRGRFLLGQPLDVRVGGVAEPDSNRLWFAATEGCIYVLDITDPDKPSCKQVVETGHAAGSLRCEPFFLPGPARQPDGYLALLQSQGASEQLHLYSLPVRDRRAIEIPIGVAQDLPGLSWTAPYHDGDRLWITTDAGQLGAFIIDEPGIGDRAVFPMAPAGVDGLDLTRMLWPHLAETSPEMTALLRGIRARSRSQVVHVRGDTLWIYARGRLQRLERGWKPSAGPVFVPVWMDGKLAELTLGDLGCEVTTTQDAQGRLTFFLTTQDPMSPAMLATAVTEDGVILWQRRLGLVIRGEPLPVGVTVDTPGQVLSALASFGPSLSPGLLVANTARLAGRMVPLILATGEDGALFAFDPLVPIADAKGLTLANAIPVAKGLAGSVDQAWLLVGTDGAVYQVITSGKDRLKVRRVAWAGKGRRLELTGEADIPLSGTPAGPPALVGQTLILPVDKGYLVRIQLMEDPQTWKAENWLGWRNTAVGMTARGYVTAISADQFLTTDGLGVLTFRDTTGILGSINLGSTRQIVGPPLLLPAAPGKMPHVLVADSTGEVVLVTLDADKRQLLVTHRIKLGGVITAGPFLCSTPGAAVRAGCIVDGTRLVLFDPYQPNLARYPATNDAEPSRFVAPPQVVRSWLIAADQDGRIMAFDPYNLAPRGRYRFRINVEPTCTPLAFGADRLFVPLRDGTVVLLPLELIGKGER